MASHAVKVNSLAGVRLREAIVLLMLTPARADGEEKQRRREEQRRTEERTEENG